MPTQSPDGDSVAFGIWPRIDCGRRARRLCCESVTSSGEFSVSTTSAGEALPSCRICVAITRLSPERMRELQVLAVVDDDRRTAASAAAAAERRSGDDDCRERRGDSHAGGYNAT